MTFGAMDTHVQRKREADVPGAVWARAVFSLLGDGRDLDVRRGRRQRQSMFQVRGEAQIARHLRCPFVRGQLFRLEPCVRHGRGTTTLR